MITSAPLALEVAGATYEFQPLSFEDFEWLELKLRARAIEAGRMAKVDIDVVLREAQKIDIFNELDSLQSPIVLSWMLQRMLRNNKKPVDRSTIEGWLRKPETRDKLLPHLSSLCGLGDPEKNAETAETKT
jgi:hypothetical protein